MPYEIYMPIEEYKDSKYPGGAKYFVSNLGNIKNYKGEIMKPSDDGRGYMKIDLRKDGKRKTHKVHRLVLSTFKANPQNKSQINHINEDKTDNRVNNLEWCTPKENSNYGKRTERIAEKNKIKVECIELNRTFDSARDAAIWLDKENGAPDITKCCKGTRTSAYGYTWKYYTEGAE